MGKKLKKFEARVTVERIFETEVWAKDEKEAEEKIYNWDFDDEYTESETILGVEVYEVQEE